MLVPPLVVNVIDAVRCALGIQSFLKEANAQRPENKKIILRIGIHLGDVIHKGKTVSGDAVNVASRIEPLAIPGGVCLTEQVYHSVLNKVDCDFESMGDPHLKNLSIKMEVFRISNLGERSMTQSLQPSSLPKNRIAVLPFANMSPDPNDDYFADGMTEELITTLSKVGELSVISRTSIMPYKKVPKTAKEVGQELQAGTIIEGSVRKAGQTLRITVQMIDAINDRHIWAESYDRNMQDVFAIQTEIAWKVMECLQVHVVDEERQRNHNPPTENIDAYTSYLQGRQFWNRRDVESVRKAMEHFRQAIVADPNYALGYSGLADCHVVLARPNGIDPRTNWEAAKGLVTKALKLDGGLAEAHATFADILEENDFDFKESEVEFKRAIALKPSYATAHQWYGQLLSLFERWDEALDEISKAMELDPLSPIIRVVRADMLGGASRDYVRWVSELKKVQKMFPDYALVNFDLARAYSYGLMFKEALEHLELGQSIQPDPMINLYRAAIYAKAGEFDQARRLLSEEEIAGRMNLALPSDLGYIHLFMGEKDRAFELFEKAYVERDAAMLYFRIDPDCDGIKSDPRYVSLLARMGLH